MKNCALFVWAIVGGLTLASAADKSAPSDHAHAAHSHGLGQLELVVQGGTVKASFEIPMESLLGFEHLPRTPEQKKAMADLQTATAQASYFITLPAAADCQPKSLQVNADMFKGKKSEHSDLDAELEFSCSQPSALKQMEIPLFKKHSRLSALKVDMVSPKGQASVTLKAKDPVLRW
jgi:hypothetical protein